MNLISIEPYRRALLDFYDGDTLAKIVIYRDDGSRETHLLKNYFSEPSSFSTLEKTALKLCSGRILDVGAGAGRHSLALQEQGRSVYAIDISPEAVEIMSKRGVKNVRCIDIYELEKEKFDTLLLMMHGVGIVENLLGLSRFLKHVYSLITPNGQILLDSLDMRRTKNLVDLAYQEFIYKKGRYIGENRLQFEYKGIKGPPFGWLHIDPQTLTDQALEASLCCRVIYMGKSGDYLAQLSPRH
ncbi:MAG: methyltransferase domain-containing protein [Desulfobacterales bacterium]|nr:methyltransferase domain-containing protein [Desulfobacterales bacterium]